MATTASYTAACTRAIVTIACGGGCLATVTTAFSAASFQAMMDAASPVAAGDRAPAPAETVVSTAASSVTLPPSLSLRYIPRAPSSHAWDSAQAVVIAP